MAAPAIRTATACLSALAVLLSAAAQPVAAPVLPLTAPRPSSRPATEAAPLHPPLPTPRPEHGPRASTGTAATGGLRPAQPESRPTPGTPADEGTSGEGRSTTPVVPTDELACRSRLRALGVDFIDKAPVSDPAGCAIAHPLVLRSLGGKVRLEPKAMLNCATAEAAARFVAEVVAPAAKSIFSADLAAVGHGSAYVCRPRHGTTKLSEHAFGNAIDIGSFTLADGRTIAVTAATDPKEADFLSRVRMVACGPFKTVLGPGSDSDHAQHFHFDLAQRRNGSTYCR